MNDAPVVSVWEPDGNEWRVVGRVLAYTTLQFESRFLEAGPWQMELPYDTAALPILPHRLLSVDWRGRTLPLRITSHNPHVDEETGQPTLTVGGKGALSLFDRVLAWPDPSKGLGSQPIDDPYTGDAETVVRQMIEGNYVDRYGAQLRMGANQNQGDNVKARPEFDNLLEIVAKKAKRGGIGVDVELVRTTGTRARLELRIWTPQDLTRRVRLTRRSGTLRNWSQDAEAPSVTHALVGGAGSGTDRVFRQVSTAASRQAADTWGGPVESFVDGPSSFDFPELDQAGEEALDEGAETNTLTMTAAESEGLRAFRDYQPGDKATGELADKTTITDVITSVSVTVNDDGVDVVPTFGDPDRKDPAIAIGKLIKGVRREVKHLQTRR